MCSHTHQTEEDSISGQVKLSQPIEAKARSGQARSTGAETINIGEKVGLDETHRGLE